MDLFYAGKHSSHRRLRRVIRILIPLLLAALVIWFALEPKQLHIEKTTITSSALSKDVGRMRIVYLSDIHYGSWPYLTQGDLNSLMTRVNEQKPDLVIFGGDYANDPEGAMELFRRLPAVHATYGTYAVLGQHDRGTDSQLNQLKAVMRQQGITPLVNETAKVRIGTQDIWLAGLDDVTNGLPALKSLAASCSVDDFVIFLSHNPSIITEALSAVDKKNRRGWFDLGLFGHTHGGQIPVLSGSLGMPAATGTYRRGWYHPNKLDILVSEGVGTSGIPLRLGCPPQIHVITVISDK